MKTSSNFWVDYHFIDDQTIEMAYKENCFIDEHAAEENNKLYLEMTKHLNKLKVLVTLANYMEVSTRGLVVIQRFDKDDEARIIKEAIVRPSYMAKVLSYVYFKMFTPSFEFRLFNDRKSAVNWLKG
ncbi:MAG: hypothetical protein ACLGGV_02865 [Bacteroidia bacterium]